MFELDDHRLLAEFVRSRSEAAFTELVSRHAGLVYSTAFRFCHNPHHAEEIAQAVFIILARKAGTLSSRVVLSGWLYQTARLTAANFVKGEIRRQRREQEAAMQSNLNETEAAAWEKIAPLLDEAMGVLGETDRNAVLLRYFENRTSSEIGAALRTNEETARKRVNRALEKLRRFFAKRGVTVSGAALSGAISAHSIQAAPVALAKTISAVALAKGAVTSTSTLTLAKIMALTKTKITVAVAVITLLGATSLTMKAIQASRTARLNALHDIQGTWEGNRARGSAGVNRNLPARNRMVLKISKNNGDYIATADLIDWGRKNVPVTVDYRYPSLHLSITPQVILNATVNADGTLLNFGGFTLGRTGAPDLVPEPLADAAFAPRAGSDLQGYWKGTIDVKPNPLPLNLKIAEDANGTFRAEVDNPNQGAMGQPATVNYQRPAMQLMLMAQDGMLQGEVNGDHTEIKGSWLDPKRTVLATFKRADFQTEHAQDAVKDYRFHSANDLQGHWEGGFLLQKKPVKFPIVLDLDIAKLPDGTFSVTVASIYQLGNDDPRPASDFQYHSPDVQIGWKWMNDRFVGQMKNGKLVGHWINGSKQWPIVFERKSK